MSDRVKWFLVYYVISVLIISGSSNALLPYLPFIEGVSGIV